MLIISACTKQDILSCDPSINKWALDNIAYYETASRDELLLLTIPEQRAIIVGLSGEKRMELWRNKLEIIKSKQLLKPEELAIYSDIIYFIKPEHFNNPDKSLELTEYAENRIHILQEEYNWEDRKVFFYFYTWLTEDEYNDALLFSELNQAVTKGSIDDGTSDCNCMPYRFECSASEICFEQNCSATQGCGLFNNNTCTGKCKFSL